MNERSDRWLLHVMIRDGERSKRQDDIPYEVVHPTREGCETEARRVLNALCDRGDDQNWQAHIAMNPRYLDQPEFSPSVYTIRHGDYPHSCRE